jgi:hypothetical protein
MQCLQSLVCPADSKNADLKFAVQPKATTSAFSGDKIIFGASEQAKEK